MIRHLTLISILIGVVSLSVYFDWQMDRKKETWNSPIPNTGWYDDSLGEQQKFMELIQVRKQIQKRDSIIDDLLAKRISPRNSLVQFEKMNQESPIIFEYLELLYPEKSTWERTAIQLTVYLEPYFEDHPQELDEWRKELRTIAKEMETKGSH
jgi:hypothetical protein